MAWNGISQELFWRYRFMQINFLTDASFQLHSIKLLNLTEGSIELYYTAEFNVQ